MKNNLWILTEERPKYDVIQNILKKFSADKNCGFFAQNLRILPILNDDAKFTFIYEIIGFSCAKIDRIYLKIISGSSSFVDFLIFYQQRLPNNKDIPLYAIEETKTDDSESRNTGIYQRCSKFVFIKAIYPSAKLIMLYNIKVRSKIKKSDTNIFGTRLLLTLGVEIIGKDLDQNTFKPFASIDEIIDSKTKMRKAPKNNVPIQIKRYPDKIQISGRLYKAGGLSHDPNIGALSLMSAAIRELGWKGIIEITQHGLSQSNLKQRNKFISIANYLDLKIYNLKVPHYKLHDEYWHYEVNGEKLGTIFVHIVVESFTQGYSIFENHAGCEKGYFITSTGEHMPLAKYKDSNKYKNGDKTQIIFIPDLILLDFERSEIINIEGKKYKFKQQGITELNNYDYIESEYINKFYHDYKIIRTVVLYGGVDNEIKEFQIGFLLNEKGSLILGIMAPELFRKAIRNLLNYWGTML